jgi:hypothetical protein
VAHNEVCPLPLLPNLTPRLRGVTRRDVGGGNIPRHLATMPMNLPPFLRGHRAKAGCVGLRKPFHARNGFAPSAYMLRRPQRLAYSG